jgi:hypothetical protein
MQRPRRGHRDATGPWQGGSVNAFGGCRKAPGTGGTFPNQPGNGRNQPTKMPYTYRGTQPAAGGRKRPPTGPEFMPICAEILRGLADVSGDVRDAIRVVLWSLRSDRVVVNMWDRIGALPIEVRVELAGLLVIEDGRREQMLEQLLAEDVEALPVRNAEQDLRALPEWACADLGPLLPGMALAGEAADGRLGDNWLGDPEGLQDPIKL